jgi:uncharacterized protein YbjT (DUF2867 family)
MPSVLLLGATGLIGSAVLRLVRDDAAFPRVVTLTRRPLGAEGAHPRVDACVGDLERMDTLADAFAVDAVICALGTTIRLAGSQARFRAVDHDIPLAAARIARQRGVTHFLYVSSIGANPRSSAFYLRTKGELEQALAGVGFDRLTIVRPSLLLGDRKEVRLGERIGQLLSFIPMGRYTAIHADDVAAALVRLAKEDGKGLRTVESSEMRAWARATPQRT